MGSSNHDVDVIIGTDPDKGTLAYTLAPSEKTILPLEDGAEKCRETE
jgi:hypothetical protein